MLAEGTMAREYSDRQQVMEHALVVYALGVDCAVHEEGERYYLLIPGSEWPRLAPELAAYDDEQAAAAPLPSGGEESLAPLWAVLLFVWFLATAWFFQLEHRQVAPEAGAVSHATLIASSEWERAVTALTLHADFGHLLSNLIVGGMFAWGLAGTLGTGWTLWSFLLAGAAGNFLNSLLRASEPGFSLGASTGVFGLLGTLVAVRVLDRLRQSGRLHLREILLPLGAGWALLALLGSEPVSVTGQAIDNTAHLFGFLSGLLLGVASAGIPERWRRSARLSLFLSLGALAFTVVCWMVALSR